MHTPCGTQDMFAQLWRKPLGQCPSNLHYNYVNISYEALRGTHVYNVQLNTFATFAKFFGQNLAEGMHTCLQVCESADTQAMPHFAWCYALSWNLFTNTAA